MFTRNLFNRTTGLVNPLVYGAKVAIRSKLFSSRKALLAPSIGLLSNNLISKRFASNVVTIEQAKAMPTMYRMMPNELILSMAVMGDQEAREERLIREIMSVDNCSWIDAQPRFLEMVSSNRKYLAFATIPYKMGIILSVGAAFGSIPMIFDINTVLWFNELYVTTGKKTYGLQ